VRVVASSPSPMTISTVGEVRKLDIQISLYIATAVAEPLIAGSCPEERRGELLLPLLTRET